MKRIALSLWLSIGLSLCLSMVMVVADAAAETRTLNYSNFDDVSVESGMRANISQGTAFRVTATGSAEDLKRLKVSQSGSRIDFSIQNAPKVGLIVLDITMPALKRLALSGGAEGNLKMPTGAPSFASTLSGGATLAGQLTSKDVTLDASGGATATLSGSTGGMRLTGSGAGQFELKNFPATSARINHSRGSTAVVTVNGRIDADVSGGSELTYHGKATLGTQNSSGGAEIRRGS
jgi:hypothetical protein